MRGRLSMGQNHQREKTAEEIYGDIINLPRYEPKNHVRMPLYKRAAQFAPFAALTGYGEAVGEAARYTEDYRELSEDSFVRLDHKLSLLMAHREEDPEVRLTCFKPDERKEGGSFLDIVCRIKKIDSHKGAVVLNDGSVIPVRNILDIQGDIFRKYD